MSHVICTFQDNVPETPCINTFLVSRDYLQLFDGVASVAMPLLYVLFEIVFPAGLEAAQRTEVWGGL